MNNRRLAALQALAERGATEGEREAARIALEKHRKKTPTIPPFSPPQPGRPSPNMSADDFLRAVFNNNYASPFYRVQYTRSRARPHPFQQEYQCRPQPPSAPKTERAADRATTSRRTTEPRVGQAVAHEFPDLLTAISAPEPDVALVEFATVAQMWERFNSDEPWQLIWRGLVWESGKPRGVLHDRSRLHFYVKVDVKKLRPVMKDAR